jgi:hypothetical protein
VVGSCPATSSSENDVPRQSGHGPEALSREPPQSPRAPSKSINQDFGGKPLACFQRISPQLHSLQRQCAICVCGVYLSTDLSVFKDSGKIIMV